MPQQADGKVWNAGYDIHTALRQLPNGDTAAGAAGRITGHATSLLDARWTRHAGAGDRLAAQGASSSPSRPALRPMGKAGGRVAPHSASGSAMRSPRRLPGSKIHVMRRKRPLLGDCSRKPSRSQTISIAAM
jgi:hypothetical protein